MVSLSCAERSEHLQKACCFKTADAETILTNLVADANAWCQDGGASVCRLGHVLGRAVQVPDCCMCSTEVNVYVFQPGGYSVHTKTTELGIYAAIMPTAPADIYFAKTLHATRSLSVDVQDDIQVGPVLRKCHAGQADPAPNTAFICSLALCAWAEVALQTSTYKLSRS